jgi:preprotein translocase subunit SecG
MAEFIHTPLTVMHIVACAFLILVILIQPGKSGGMGGVFGAAGAQQVFGGRGAGNFLTKTTWVTAALFFATSITLAYLSSSTDDALMQKSESLSASKAPVKLPGPASSK